MSSENSRLMASLSGTNLERAADYNQRVVLQAIRLGGDVTRSELVERTALTPPTIAKITRRLVAAGLVQEVGRPAVGRGQPAVRLAINPDGALTIGLNIDRDHVTLVTLDLAGEVRSRVSWEQSYPMPDQVRRFVAEELEQVRKRLGPASETIVGAGIAVPEPFAKTGFHDQPLAYAVWNDINVAAFFADVLPGPILVDNDAAAAALGERQFGNAKNYHSFFYLLVSAGLGGGMVVDGSFYRGGIGRSGEIGFIPSRTPASYGRPIEQRVSMSALYDRLTDAGFPSGTLAELDHRDPRREAVIATWIDEASDLLLDPLIAVNCVVNPQVMLIGGRLPTRLIDALVDSLTAKLADYRDTLPSVAPIQRAAMASDAPAIGAALLPFSKHLLPSESILMNTRR